MATLQSSRRRLVSVRYCVAFILCIMLYIAWFSNTNITICCNDLFFSSPPFSSPLPIDTTTHISSISIAHGENGAAAGKQTKVAVKTNNGVKTAQKTTAGAYREKKEWVVHIICAYIFVWYDMSHMYLTPLPFSCCSIHNTDMTLTPQPLVMVRRHMEV